MKQLIYKLKEPYVLILVGPPLSGKSTFVNNLKANGVDNFTIISRDNILMETYIENFNPEVVTYTDAWNKVNQKSVDSKLMNLMETVEGNVIIDMTHVSTKRRKYHLSFFPDHYKVAVIFPLLAPEEIIRRNEKRTQEESKYISPGIIKNMIDSLQPIKDEEGFDYIYHVK